MLTRDNMTQILAKHTDIHVDKPTINRYQKIGLMRPSHYVRNRGDNKATRVYYEPLAAVEFATAALLFRGDWLSRRSKIRIGRCTDAEIRYGRSLFYNKNSKLLPKEIRKEWKEQLKQYDEIYAVIHSDMPASFIKARRQYLYELYQSIFWYMYGILKEDLEEKETA